MNLAVKQALTLTPSAGAGPWPEELIFSGALRPVKGHVDQCYHLRNPTHPRKEGTQHVHPAVLSHCLSSSLGRVQGRTPGTEPPKGWNVAPRTTEWKGVPWSRTGDYVMNLSTTAKSVAAARISQPNRVSL